MADARPFLSQTARTASFAFREYFRPLVIVAGFLTSRLAPAEPAESTPESPGSLEDTKAILRQRLVHGRHYEKLLLMQGMICALASLLALAMSLMFAFEMPFAVVLAILVPASTFVVWVLLRLVQTREEIIELKTIRWVMKSVDKETAERVAKQVLWGKSEKKRRPKKDKNPT